jgi:hypothetical protein
MLRSERLMNKICVLSVCVTVGGSALFAQTESGLETKLEGSGVVITKYTGWRDDVVIPESIEGKPVIGIGRRAFGNRDSLLSVTIPEGAGKG